MYRSGAEWNDGGGHSTAMRSCHPDAPLEPIWLGQPLPFPAVSETGMKARNMHAETAQNGGLGPKLSAECDVGFSDPPIDREYSHPFSGYLEEII